MASQQPREKTIKVHFCSGQSITRDNLCRLAGMNTSFPKSKLLAGLFLLVFLGFIIWLRHPQLEHWVSQNEQTFTQWLKPEALQGLGWLLLPVAFIGGLVSSLSPCILALLPVNLSYIGSLNTASKAQAFAHAAAFVLGAVLVLSLFGLFSSFAGAVIVDYKGYVNIAVGLVSVLLAIGMLGAFELKMPSLVTSMPQGAGPFMVGATFALVTSPCGSPVLLALLLAAGSTGNVVLGALTMASYALGYTVILFISSLLAGFSKQIGALRQHAKLITQLGSYLLILIGLYYLYAGISWFVA